MKLMLSLFILGFSLSAFSSNVPQSQTVAQVGGKGIAYQPTSDGNIPCADCVDRSPIIPESEYAYLMPSEGQVIPAGTGTGSTDGK